MQLGRDEQEAITHLQNQMEALAQIRANAEQAHADSPQFIRWESHTTDLLRHYISRNSEHLSRFNSLSFRSNVMRLDFPGGGRFRADPRRDDREKFTSDADVAVACLQGAIEHIKVFGLKQEEPAAPAKPDQHWQRNHSPAAAYLRINRIQVQIRSFLLPDAMTNNENMRDLIGTWRSEPDDTTSERAYGSVTLKFFPDGTLLYIVHESSKDQVIRLTYQVDSGFIITDQPSDPRVERTAYELTQDGKLTLAFGGQKSHYVRVEQVARWPR